MGSAFRVREGPSSAGTEFPVFMNTTPNCARVIKHWTKQLLFFRFFLGSHWDIPSVPLFPPFILKRRRFLISPSVSTFVLISNLSLVSGTYNVFITFSKHDFVYLMFSGL